MTQEESIINPKFFLIIVFLCLIFFSLILISYDFDSDSLINTRPPIEYSNGSLLLNNQTIINGSCVYAFAGSTIDDSLTRINRSHYCLVE